MRLIGSLLIWIGISVSLFGFGQIESIQYSYLENFKGWLLVPQTESNQKFPVIIYNYDQTFDWLGDEHSTRQGYNLQFFMREFAKRGYLTFIPIERYRKLKSIKGAIFYLSKHPSVDPRNIHVIGASEGAFLSLLLDEFRDQVRTISVLSPRSLNDTGHFSIPGLLRHYKPGPPVFLGIAKKERRWIVKRVNLIYEVLKEKNTRLTVRKYDFDRKWFWMPTNYYMNDIFAFIQKHSIP